MHIALQSGVELSQRNARVVGNPEVGGCPRPVPCEESLLFIRARNARRSNVSRLLATYTFTLIPKSPLRC